MGGAATPAPSPDGKALAYTRRIRAKTRLEMLDLATGATKLVADDIERDGQEGFAFHGVFPGYAWLPNAKEIVATADGKIWRFDAASGARRAVPFTAAVEQSVTDAVRFPRKIAGDTVRSRILRWPVESPDGKKLVFSAVGHLWVMDLPGGAPKRLTNLEDFEYSPTFSADGSSLAFVTWNDAAGGHVWTLAMVPGAAPRRITKIPSQYVNPTFSRDASKIAFLKGSGATFRDEDLVSELWHEIHWIDAGGGDSHFVTSTKNRGTNRRMARPQFSADGARLFWLEDDPPANPTKCRRRSSPRSSSTAPIANPT